MPEPFPPPVPPPPGPGADACVPGALAVVLDEIEPARVADLVVWVRGLLDAGGATCLRCDVAALGRADLDAVDTLAQLALVARRAGVGACVWRASPELSDLIGLAGLARVLPTCRWGAANGGGRGGADRGGRQPQR